MYFKLSALTAAALLASHIPQISGLAIVEDVFGDADPEIHGCGNPRDGSAQLSSQRDKFLGGRRKYYLNQYYKKRANSNFVVLDSSQKTVKFFEKPIPINAGALVDPNQLPRASAGGFLKALILQINMSGAGPFNCKIDQTGAAKNWMPDNLEITGQTPILANPALDMSQIMLGYPLQIELPTDLQCTGSYKGLERVCMVQCENRARIGPAGGCIPFQQVDKPGQPIQPNDESNESGGNLMKRSFKMRIEKREPKGANKQAAQQAAQARAAQKQQEKAAKAAQKAQEKAAKQAAKQAEKQAKQAAKQAEKQAKQAQKAAQKQAADQAKQAQKQAKQAAKAEKKEKKADKKEAKAARKEAKKDAKADKKAAKKAAKEAKKQAKQDKKNGKNPGEEEPDMGEDNTGEEAVEAEDPADNQPEEPEAEDNTTQDEPVEEDPAEEAPAEDDTAKDDTAKDDTAEDDTVEASAEDGTAEDDTTEDPADEDADKESADKGNAKPAVTPKSNAPNPGPTKPKQK
ncbi:hypothetical protein ABW20_dc0102063 [Dactylellina cionopaga]|nr:hypothetical protein ABW20_dc0102063 [Dactylellina cionopaga]